MPAHTRYKALSDEEIISALQTELTRLLASGLTQEEEVIARRYYSQKEREGMDADSFCGPGRSFPVTSQEDVTNAAGLAGHADDPDAVRACIKRKAKANGWKLPDSWQDSNKERAMTAIERADGNHDPFTGTHAHAHPTFGAQGDDENHSHDHSHEERAVPTALNAVIDSNFSLSFPIVRSDDKKWIVYGRATVEEPDKHGTIFSYEGAKGAFERWVGNIREQHDPKRPIGSRVKHEFNNDEKGVYLWARVSKTRPETWERVTDGTLNDFSVSVIPAEKYGTDTRTWPKKEHNGKQYPYLPEYDYAEISLVDSGSAPGARFIPLARADGTFTEEFMAIEDEPETPILTLEQQQEEVQRAGATISAATKSKLHESIGHTLMAAKSQMQNCATAGCPDCTAAMAHLDPDNDGDIDAYGGVFGDTDGDAASLSSDESDTERAMTAMIERVVTAQLTPVYARLQGIAGTLSRANAQSGNTANIESLITGAITRAVDAAHSANASNLAEVRTELSVVKEQVAVIAKQPLPGAPIQHAGSVARSSEKRLATDPYVAQRHYGSAVERAIAEMSERGDLNSVQQQEDAAYAMLLAQQRGGR